MAATSSPQLRRTLALSGLGVAALVSARQLLKPLPGVERRLVDWEAVTRDARRRAGGVMALADLEHRSGHYDVIAHHVAGWMPEVTEVPLTTYPAFTAVDRGGFIAANIATIQRLTDPLEQARGQVPGTRLSLLSQRVSDHYLAQLMSLLARRVLGQYDPVFHLDVPDDGLPEPALYMVEPNLQAFHDEEGVDPEGLRRWIVLHELTHAWQFGDHAWLRDHIVGLISTVIATGVETTPDGRRRLRSNRDVLQRMPRAMGEQIQTLQHVQALMSVLEGYATFLMNDVGRRHLADFEHLETAFAHRGRRRPPLERIVFALTGMRMKLRQYAVGEHFCQEVVEHSSLAVLNRVWEGADLMPTGAELKTPRDWIARVG